MLATMTAVMRPSKAEELISLKSILRRNWSGSRNVLMGFAFAIAFIDSTHCICSGVIVADASLSFLMRVKLSTTVPTKRLRATKLPTSIHSIAKIAAAERSLRTGACPGSVAAIIAHIGSSHESPELMM